MSRETPLCIHDYLNADCDCDTADDYDPSTFSPTFDNNVDIASFDQEQYGANQTDSPRNTTQNEQRASTLLSSFDEQVSSGGYDNVDSDSSDTVGDFGYSPNHDSDFQENDLYGADPSLSNFDLRTPASPSTPNFYLDDEEISSNPYDNASNSLPAEQASSSHNHGHFQCRERLKTFNSKSKYR